MVSTEITFAELFEFLGVTTSDKMTLVGEQLFVETPEHTLTPILGVIKKSNHEMWQYTLEDETNFIVSDKHLLFDRGTMTFAGNCEYVDTTNRGSVKVVGKKYIETGDVYDISINAPHLYVTPNNVIHHNTTLLLQVLELLEKSGKKTAYISGEEVVHQLAFTCRRLDVKNVSVANITYLEDIVEAVEKNNFDMVVIDSFPAIRTRTEMRQKQREELISNTLVELAKRTETVIGVILHFTKSGSYKGSTLLPHSVDCNMVMIRNEEDEGLRDIEVTKNRMGSTGTVTFPFTDRGFQFVRQVQSAQPSKKSGSSAKDQILKYVVESPKPVTIKEIVDHTGKSKAYVDSIVRELVNDGLIVKNGRGQQTALAKKA